MKDRLCRLRYTLECSQDSRLTLSYKVIENLPPSPASGLLLTSSVPRLPSKQHRGALLLSPWSSIQVTTTSNRPRGPRGGPVTLSDLEWENPPSRGVHQHGLSPSLGQLISIPCSHLTSKLLQEVGSKSLLSTVWIRKLRLGKIKATKQMQFAGGRHGVPPRTHQILTYVLFTISCGLIQTS